MMKFTNAEDFQDTATRLGLAGWYAQDSSGEYLGVVRQDADTWLIGFTLANDVPFPIAVDRVPQ